MNYIKNFIDNIIFLKNAFLFYIIYGITPINIIAPTYTQQHATFNLG